MEDTLHRSASSNQSKNSSGGKRDSNNPFLANGRARRASSVEGDVSNRRALWSAVQDKLGYLLAGVTINSKSKMKMEDLLQVLDYSHQIVDLGQKFCGSESKKLRKSVVEKCEQYVVDFQNRTFENFHATLENETWRILPVPKDFGLHSIKEFNESPSARQTSSRSSSNATNGAGDEIRVNGFERSRNAVTASGEAIDPFEEIAERENMFRLASEKLRHKDLDDEKHSYSSDEDDTAYSSSTFGRNRSSDVYKRIPLVTNASLTIVKKMGSCLTMMETLKPVASQAFAAIKDLFDYYLYSVFMIFGLGKSIFFPPKPEQVAAQKQNVFGQTKPAEKKKLTPPYPVLLKAVNRIRAGMGSHKFGGKARKDIPVNGEVKVNLTSHDRLRGVIERTIAAESLVFIVEILSKLDKRIQDPLPIHEKLSVSQFVLYAQQVVGEFQNYIYRNVATFLIDLKQIREMILKVDWTPNTICDTHCEYVNVLLNQFDEFLHRMKDMGGLPDFIMQRLERETILFMLERITEAYAEIPKCSAEGRARMSIDQQALRTGLQELTKQESDLVETDPMPKWEMVNRFIGAYYYPQQDLINFTEEHASEYRLEHFLSLARCGVAGSEIRKRNAKKEFEQEIERAFFDGNDRKKS